MNCLTDISNQDGFVSVCFLFFTPYGFSLFFFPSQIIVNLQIALLCIALYLKPMTEP